MRWIGLAAVLAMAVSGCELLPSEGPPGAAVQNVERKVPKPPFVLVQIDEKVANVTGQFRPANFSSISKISESDERPRLNLEVGDKITINIYEAGADGLFSSAEAKATQIEAEVAANGQVFVPYVGPLLAAGRSPDDLRAAIENSLVDKAIQPQVQVAVSESLANSVTVVGDVETPGRQPVPIAGARVLDAIASAGEVPSAPYETKVVLRRGSLTASADLEDLIDDPAENILLEPGDVIFVGDETRTFTAMGAVGEPGEQPFEARRVTLAEGLARVGGLDPERANARQVFVFRFEPAVIAKALNERAVTAPDGTQVPVIYRLNMKDPKSMFLAQVFELRDEDMIFVGAANSLELQKFLEVIAPVVQLAVAGAAISNAFD